VLWDAPQIIVSKRFPLAANAPLFENVQSEFENQAAGKNRVYQERVNHN